MDNQENNKKFTILLVEDDIPSRLFVSTVIKNKAEKLILAENGKEGLEQFLINIPDIVITDIGMPFMNGLEMSRIIKTNKPKTQIILTTIFDSSQRLLEAIDIGINQYLTKPISKDRLLKAVDRAIEILNLEREVEQQQIALKKAHNELEIRVDERTSELKSTNEALLKEIEFRKKAEKELINAKNQAESANKAKDAFLAKVNHELRTPLNGILGITSILLGTEINEKQRNFLEMVKSSADSLLRIINDILDYSKIELGRLEIQLSECNLSKCINHVIELLSIQAKNKDLYIKKDFSEGLTSKVYCDERRLQQILINLIGNAIKFTEKGGIEIVVRKENETDENVTILFKVKDTGIGIAKDKVNLLFKSFSQVDDSLTRRHGGTGLGLAISKDLVELMNGKIWFESNLDVGSTFSFLLTLKKVKTKNKGLEKAPSETLKDSDIISKFPDVDINILIVEDSVINQEVMKHAFLQKNWHVYSALTGKDAIEIVNNTDINIIIMDIELGDLNGIEVTQMIRASNNPNINSIPIIGLTGHTEPEFLVQAILKGMNSCLTKPFAWVDIFNNIYKYINFENKSIKEDISAMEKLLQALNNNEELLIHLVNYFKLNYQKTIDSLEKALSENDNIAIQKIAHKFKSEVGNFDSDKLVELTRKIENKGKNNDLTDIPSDLNELKNELVKLVDTLDKYVLNIQKK
jgi:signal transduction histidine kinase/HPt (histidine-containing phosphotransfer) domain-containing protein